MLSYTVALLEQYRMGDAEACLFPLNSAAETVKDAVDELCSQGTEGGRDQPQCNQAVSRRSSKAGYKEGESRGHR